MFKNRIGGQKQGLNAGELAIDQRHAQFGLVIAVLTQSFDDDGGADLLAVVRDNAIGGGDDDVGAAGFLQRAANYLDSRAFGKHRCFRGIDGHHHVYLVKESCRALDYIQVSGGDGVIRAGAYCDSHAF